MNYGLQGKNALITGAAGGFGSALARVLAAGPFCLRIFRRNH